jgi:hypothetical protein
MAILTCLYLFLANLPDTKAVQDAEKGAQGADESTVKPGNNEIE